MAIIYPKDLDPKARVEYKMERVFIGDEFNLRRHLTKEFKELKIVNVQNQIFNGVPDTHFVYKKMSGWIELKITNSLKKNIGIDEWQFDWMRRYLCEFGGFCFVLVYVRSIDAICILGKKEILELDQQKDHRPQHLKDFPSLPLIKIYNESTHWEDAEYDKKQQVCRNEFRESLKVAEKMIIAKILKEYKE